MRIEKREDEPGKLFLFCAMSGGWWHIVDEESFVAAVLAAVDNAVIVVDGRVVEWEKVEEAVVELCLDNDPCAVVWHQAKRLAARDVAEEEDRD